MNGNGLISLAIIAVTVYFSYKGIKSRAFFKKYSFGVDKVLLYKDYKVMLTSGLVHVNWLHLIFNMVSLFLFSQGLELYLGEWKFLLIYVLSLLGGNVFSLLLHRHHGDYTAAGASGAVCGLIFASIALFPDMSIMFIPAWLFGIIYVLYSIYGIRSNSSNIGHEAHLAGALVGMISAIIMSPEVLRTNYVPILL
ncbi:MAG TPA: rhomboid family intramembrane serine protease, partial [Chitinophagaceae bacterium]|nr:rhomboid family intramembrane serine protease [Chitinophagaceae bacterium]